jgi:hypothetical protein
MYWVVEIVVLVLADSHRWISYLSHPPKCRIQKSVGALQVGWKDWVPNSVGVAPPCLDILAAGKPERESAPIAPMLEGPCLPVPQELVAVK